MKPDIIQLLVNLFNEYSGNEAESMTMLPASGSYREYIRIEVNHFSAIGVYNPDLKENEAFIGFSKHFKDKGLPVPEIYKTQLEDNVYLIEDLGHITLFDFLQKNKIQEGVSEELELIYKKTLGKLIDFQLEGSKGLNFDLCYPRKAFDKQSMMWDLSYFKYYFLKLARIPFDEQALEHDFVNLTDYLLQADHDYFLYRDFQSRNIMIKGDEPYFIDYQGGRRGALQYDVASLLYDAKAALPQEFRNKMFKYYISELSKKQDVDEKEFTKYYVSYVYIRIMQAMGAYGFRGFYEQKEHFLKSIPYALENIKYLLNENPFPIELPELTKVLNELINNERLQKINSLTVTVNSFSYKRGIPFDYSGNGGGFVFDCRAIHNPGRYEQYKKFCGFDQPVIDFFENEPEMHQFLEGVFPLVSQSVEKYIKRNFKHLNISFGCTGGQHRSVYSAEQLAKYLKNKYSVTVVVNHIEQELKSK